MSFSSENPWATGPYEILKHANHLLDNDSDTNRRLAMILTDNAVEQMIKTYLSLPKRITDIQIPRKKRDELFQSFPSLLDAIEEYANNKLEGIDLGSIEWYHRLRNELYHQGFGLTVEREKVEIYFELANVLFNNLYGVKLPDTERNESKKLGEFIQLWNRLEFVLIEMSSTNSLLGKRPHNALQAVKYLYSGNIITEDEFKFIEKMRELRNEVVHGQVNFKRALSSEILQKLEKIVISMEEVIGEQNLE